MGGRAANLEKHAHEPLLRAHTGPQMATQHSSSRCDGCIPSHMHMHRERLKHMGRRMQRRNPGQACMPAHTHSHTCSPTCAQGFLQSHTPGTPSPCLTARSWGDSPARTPHLCPELPGRLLSVAAPSALHALSSCTERPFLDQRQGECWGGGLAAGLPGGGPRRRAEKGCREPAGPCAAGHRRGVGMRGACDGMWDRGLVCCDGTGLGAVHAWCPVSSHVSCGAEGMLSCVEAR